MSPSSPVDEVDGTMEYAPATSPYADAYSKSGQQSTTLPAQSASGSAYQSASMQAYPTLSQASLFPALPYGMGAGGKIEESGPNLVHYG